MTDERTIAERLAEAGFTYRVDREMHDGKNTIYKDGEIVGRFTAFEACDMLAKRAE